MARISEYTNQHTTKSTGIIEKIMKTAPLSRADIQGFQHQYGISDVLLAQLLRVPKSAVSNWKKDWEKKGVQVPPYIEQHIRFVFDVFKKEFDK